MKSRTLPRPASAVWIPLVVWVLLAFAAVDVLLRGTRGDWLFFLPPVVLFAWLLWLALWAPRLIVEAERLVVRDVLRTFALPWASITGIRPGTMLRIDYLDASGRPRILRPWNGLGARTDRPDPDAAASVARARPGQPLTHRPPSRRPVRRTEAADVLVDVWHAAEPSPAAPSAQTRWHGWEMAVTVLLVAACIAPHLFAL